MYFYRPVALTADQIVKLKDRRVSNKSISCDHHSVSKDRHRLLHDHSMSQQNEVRSRDKVNVLQDVGTSSASENLG